MSLRSLLLEVITIVTPGSTTDAYNSTTPDWSVATRSDYRGRLEQTAATEVTVDRDTLVSDWRVFLTPESVVDGHSRVEAGGLTFEVVGAPNVQWGRSAPHHLVVLLRLIEGG